MINEFSRTELLLGKDGVERLKNSTIAVFGVGGVGSYTAEALARSGVGKLILVDNDTVNVTNINRQIIALQSTTGKLKTEAMQERIMDINPECEVIPYNCYFTKDEVSFEGVDYIADAIDSVTSKLNLIEKAIKEGIPIISAMGTGNKLDPLKLELTDISKTSMCPLAKVIRTELRKRGINHHKVVYSTEQPVSHKCESEEDQTHRKTIGSVSFVPSVAGLIIAGEIIKSIAFKE